MKKSNPSLPDVVIPKDKALDAACTALETAINTVECTSLDVRTGEKLPWYIQAHKALVLAGRPWDAQREMSRSGIAPPIQSEFVASETIEQDCKSQDEVGKALAELREMFPGEFFRASIDQCAEINEVGEIHWRENSACVMQLSQGLDGFYNARTLSEAVAKVRQFKEQQK